MDSEYQFKRFFMSSNFNRFVKKVLQDLRNQLGISWDSSSFQAGYSEEELREAVTRFMDAVQGKRELGEDSPTNSKRLERDLQNHVEGSGTGPGEENIVIEINGDLRFFNKRLPAHYKLTIDGVTLRQDEVENMSIRIDSDAYRSLSSDDDWE